MATGPKATEAPNRCDVVDGNANDKPKPISMSRFLDELSPTEQMKRLANYSKDPKTYLESFLGSETFQTRKDLLCIPDKVDKDVYGTGEHKAHFQQHIAKLIGKEHGLFFLTGVQAQLAAMKIHCERAGNNRVAWHVSSHLESAEENAYKELYGLERILLGSSKEELPTVGEIKEVLSLPSDQRPAAILVEIPNRTLGCKTYSFSELETISSACKEADVKFHCDGARLWEIEPYYQKTAGKTFPDIGRLFDSIYVSFYKGMRGAAGATLVHNEESFIKEAKMWQRRAGGNAFTLMYEVIDCERGYNENIGTFEAKWDKMTEIVDGVTAGTKKFQTSNGNQIVTFMPEKATCCQIRTVFQGYTIDELSAARDKVGEKKGVRVFERLFPKKTLDEQAQEDRSSKKEESNDSKAKANGECSRAEEPDRRHIIEWMIVSGLLDVETEKLVGAYAALCEELMAGGAP